MLVLGNTGSDGTTGSGDGSGGVGEGSGGVGEGVGTGGVGAVRRTVRLMVSTTLAPVMNCGVIVVIDPETGDVRDPAAKTTVTGTPATAGLSKLIANWLTPPTTKAEHCPLTMGVPDTVAPTAVEPHIPLE